jgi:hypothetical protein
MLPLAKFLLLSGDICKLGGINSSRGNISVPNGNGAIRNTGNGPVQPKRQSGQQQERRADAEN